MQFLMSGLISSLIFLFKSEIIRIFVVMKTKDVLKKEFIEKALKVHADENLDYSQVNYINNRTPVKIIDHDLRPDGTEYGEYWQTPSNHLKGQHHPDKANRIKKAKRTESRDKVIERLKKVRPNDNIDFSQIEYVNMHTPVLIFDHELDSLGNEYGPNYIEPNSYLKGFGTFYRIKREREIKQKILQQKKLEKEKIKEQKRLEKLEELKNKKKVIRYIAGYKMTLDEFIARAKQAHPNENLDYSQANYINNRTPIKIIDHDLRPDGTEYGEYWQTPYHHINGASHPDKFRSKLRELKQKSNEQVIADFKKAHPNDNIDYSKVNYINNRTPITIIDNTLDALGNSYGEYEVYYDTFSKGGYSNTRKKRDTYNHFFIKSKELHGDKDDYSKVEFEKNTDEVTIICKKHGEYKQKVFVHLCGSRCPKCWKENQKDDLKRFIEKANKIHKNKYDYTKVNYVGSKTKIIINCPIHGDFLQSPDKHLFGQGCPNCANIISKPEKEIADFIISLVGKENVICNDRKLLEGKELDIYVPSHNFAIEYDGLSWHSEMHKNDRLFHLYKTEECKKQGIRLIHIFEDEYLYSKEIVLNKIRHILGKDENCIKVGARKCTICEIDKILAKDFLNRFHIQGYSSASVYLGAFYEEKLVGVMTFVQEKKLEWNLSRFATDTNYILSGLANKLFKYFTKNYEFNTVKSFLDRRWNTEGNTVYEKLGFVVDEIEKPDYYYTKNHERIHKFNFRKQRLHKKYGLPLTMTEKEMAKELGYSRIWNCGLVRYIFHKP
jgi:hypothetical protein